MAGVLALLMLLAGLFTGQGPERPRERRPERPRQACQNRVLVLSAFPAELDAVLAKGDIRPRRAVVAAGRTFYLARLAGHQVVLAMTSIGPVNARETTQAAIDRFVCGTRSEISAVVFSGVAGSTRYIGDVTVPERWSGDGGATWLDTDPGMLATALEVAAASVPLAHDNPAPDPLCACTNATGVRTVRFSHTPTITVGGDGITTDPFGGRAFPCFPFGGDIFGCRLCRARPAPAPDFAGFAAGALPFVNPAFITSYLAAPEASSSTAMAADNETAAVGEVATAHAIPFIGFRGVSDGQGDPLMLPGFPVQFFAYYPIAADNAAAVTMAFLERWPVAAPS